MVHLMNMSLLQLRLKPVKLLSYINYINPDVLDQDIIMETDEIRAIREISGIDLSIFEVSLNNYTYIF